MKIGIIRERKLPADRRTVLSPIQCKNIQSQYPQIQILVEPSPDRIFDDSSYIEEGIKLQEDLSECDVLLGVKEVPPAFLIPQKTYFFFAHVIKEQAHNQALMKALLSKQIRMIDFETLTDEQENRIIGFGEYAGMVGAYNGIKAWGLKNKLYRLPFAYETSGYDEMINLSQKALASCPVPLKIVATGKGRVGNGIQKYLQDCKLTIQTPVEYLQTKLHRDYCILGSKELYQHKEGKEFNSTHFYAHPTAYESLFMTYFAESDIVMNGVFWKEGIPRLITKEMLRNLKKHAMVIADISCDIEGSVALTHRVSSIPSPCYGINLKTFEETAPYLTDTLEIMAVPNLPAELPKDASLGFGTSFIKEILPELLKNESYILEKATICKNGKLNTRFSYLENYANL